MTTTPGLLLLHGLGDSGACWGPFVARLRREPGMAALVVDAPDAPAHGGRRIGPGETAAWPDLLADAAAHAADLAGRTGGQIVLAGHSMGAMTALGVAARHPELVRATFLEDPPLVQGLAPEGSAPPPAGPTDVSEFRDWFASLQAGSLEDVLCGVRAEHPDWDPEEYEPWARAKQGVQLEAFARPLVFVHSEVDSIIRAAPAPVVVAAGLEALGGMLSAAAEADLATLPGWSIHRLGTGHDVRRDAPEATAALLAGLIRSAC